MSSVLDPCHDPLSWGFDFAGGSSLLLHPPTLGSGPGFFLPGSLTEGEWGTWLKVAKGV